MAEKAPLLLVLAATLTFGALARAAVASPAPADLAPDLVAQRIEFMDCKPRIGVTVYNQTGVPVASPFDVRLTVLDARTSARVAQTESTLGGLGAFSSARVVFDAPAAGVLTAEVDPTRVIRETNEDNNTSKVDAESLVKCPTVSVSGGSATEGAPVRFTIRLDHGFNQPVKVGYLTEDRNARGTEFGLVASGTTACNADYIRARGVVEFPAGTTELVRTVSIATCIDSTAEGVETFALRLDNLVNTYVSNTNPGSGIAEGRIGDAPR